jgi:hypothetical protein
VTDPSGWGIEDLILKMSIGSDSAAREFLQRYHRVFAKTASSISIPGLELDEKERWLFAYLIDKKLTYLVSLFANESFTSLDEEVKANIVGGYLKKILNSGKIALIKEYTLFDPLNEEDHEQYLQAKDAQTKFEFAPLGSLVPQERTIFLFRSFGLIDCIELDKEDWEYLEESTGFQRAEVELKLDKEILKHPKRVRPISTIFIAELLDLSESNVDKIYQRVRDILKVALASEFGGESDDGSHKADR